VRVAAKGRVEMARNENVIKREGKREDKGRCEEEKEKEEKRGMRDREKEKRNTWYY
jgi:hypothetical protein